MAKDSSELAEFINAVRKGIETAQENALFELLTPIEFEISVIVKKEGKGGINIVIVGAGGKYEKESVSKIKFSMGNPLSTEQFIKHEQLRQMRSKVSNETK